MKIFSNKNLIAVLLALVGIVQCPLALAENILVEDFWQRGGPNRLGGASKTWSKNGARVSVLYEKDNVREGLRGKPRDGYAMRLKFDVSGNRQEIGWWTGMKGRSLVGYGDVDFWVQGEIGSENLWIGVKDSLWYESRLPVCKYVPAGVSDKWTHIRIPLRDFTKVQNWASIENISFTVIHEGRASDKGSLAIDQVEFTQEKDGVKAVPVVQVSRPMPDLAKLSDDAFLDMIERAGFDYFLNESNPSNGLTKDLCLAYARDNYPFASTAAVGFSLTALCIGVERNWISRQEAYERILATLQFFADRIHHEHGFFYHFLDRQTGDRAMDSEISSVDTALFLAGALFAGRYFSGTQIESLAEAIYRRVDWGWLLTDDGYVGMGWTPERGFIQNQWTDYSELMIIYLLAIGSPTHPISARAWDRWSRDRRSYGNHTFSGASPLFVHQYSHCWVDFRDIRDQHMNYFENSINATLANRQWWLNNAKRFKSNFSDLWGITACDGPGGYTAYGAPFGFCDGTIAPTAAGGSIVFTPEFSLKALKDMYGLLGARIWGRYGFVDSFNLEKNWVSKKNIGINVGPMVLMIENYRSGFVWNTFMSSGWLRRALTLCEFKTSRSSSSDQRRVAVYHERKAL